MFDNEILLTPLNKDTIQSYDTSDIFIKFINKLEGFKTKCKNLHWSAPKKNIHVYLDEFLDILSDYQDSLAEGYMGILGKMQPNAVSGVPCDSLNALDFIREVKNATLKFYDSIPQETIYKGITSECETFIQNINKYCYLFNLCDIHPY